MKRELAESGRDTLLLADGVRSLQIERRKIDSSKLGCGYNSALDLVDVSCCSTSILSVNFLSQVRAGHRELDGGAAGPAGQGQGGAAPGGRGVACPGAGNYPCHPYLPVSRTACTRPSCS